MLNNYLKTVPNYLLESSVFDVVITDLKGDYVFVNKTFKRRFEFITSQFIGKPSSISIHPDDIEIAEHVVIQCFKNPDQPIPVQLRKPLKNDKNFYWTQWEFSLLSDENKQPIGILCVGYDITEPKQNLIELRQSKVRLKKIIEAVPHPLVIINGNFNLKFINNEFEKVFGYVSKHILETHIDFLFSEDYKSDYLKLLKNYLNNDAKTLKFNQYVFCQNSRGGMIPMGVSLSSFKINSEFNIVIILEDLTDIKAHKDTIINQNKALRDISWKHSHEIRKPVVNIIGLSSLFQMENKQKSNNSQTIEYLLEAANELDLLTKKIVTEANNVEFRQEFKNDFRFL